MTAEISATRLHGQTRPVARDTGTRTTWRTLLTAKDMNDVAESQNFQGLDGNGAVKETLEV